VLLGLFDPAPASAHPVRFDVTHDRAGYRIEASADLVASEAVAWETLTDYERLPQFVPGIRSVRILEAHEDGGMQHLLIEQAGELRFLFFSRRVAVLLDVRQQPRTRVEARALPGPTGPGTDGSRLNHFEGIYTLAPIAGGVRLNYRAQFAPEFALPPILGALAVRRTMQAQFEAMLAEIDRRRLAFTPQGSRQ
jgi:hypothetical protein